MKKIIRNLLIFTVVTFMISSCSITMPVAVSDAPIGKKKGKSTTGILFGAIYLNPNYGVAEAAKRGKLTGGIATVDEKTTSYVVFMKKELIVTGERIKK